MSYAEGIGRFARERVFGEGYLAPMSASRVVSLTVAGEDTIARAQNLLAGIQGGLDKALQDATSRSAGHLRSISTKTIRERYDISAANVRANENITVRYQYKNGIQVYACFAGYLIPLIRFGGASPKSPVQDKSRRMPVWSGGSWKLMYPSPPAHGHVLKGTSPALFSHAFTARMGSTGHVGIYERTGGMTMSDKDEIEELFGPSIPEMLGNEEVAEKLTAEAMEYWNKRLDDQINAILSGYR